MKRKQQWQQMLTAYGFRADEARRLVAAAMEADPTSAARGGAYVTWIIRQVRAGEIRLPDGVPEVRFLLESWEGVKNGLGFHGARDVNLYTFHQLEALVYMALGQSSERQRRSKIKKEGAVAVYESGRYRILKIETALAMAAYSRATRWCVIYPQHAAHHYLAWGPLYLILMDGRPHALAHPASFELRDTADRPMRPDRELVAALAAATAPNGFLFAARLEARRCYRLEARRCYRERDFAALCNLLRDFDGMNLLACSLGYLGYEWIQSLWEVFRFSRASWARLRAARPDESGSRARSEWWQAMAFLRDLRLEWACCQSAEG